MKRNAIIAVVAIFVAAAVSVFVYFKNEECHLVDALLAENVEVLTAIEKRYCYSGGEGASSCSIGAGVDILGNGISTECSVTCNTGYYACCGLGCVCVRL